jgi:chromate transport protein ChrA
MAIITADRTANTGAKALTAAVIIYIAAALISLGAQALNTPAPAEAITTLLITATLAATVGVLAIWAAVIIGAIHTRQAKGQD